MGTALLRSDEYFGKYQDPFGRSMAMTRPVEDWWESWMKRLGVDEKKWVGGDVKEEEEEGEDKKEPAEVVVERATSSAAYMTGRVLRGTVIIVIPYRGAYIVIGDGRLSWICDNPTCPIFHIALQHDSAGRLVERTAEKIFCCQQFTVALCGPYDAAVHIIQELLRQSQFQHMGKDYLKSQLHTHAIEIYNKNNTHTLAFFLLTPTEEGMDLSYIDHKDSVDFPKGLIGSIGSGREAAYKYLHDQGLSGPFAADQFPLDKVIQIGLDTAHYSSFHHPTCGGVIQSFIARSSQGKIEARAISHPALKNYIELILTAESVKVTGKGIRILLSWANQYLLPYLSSSEKTTYFDGHKPLVVRVFDGVDPYMFTRTDLPGRSFACSYHELRLTWFSSEILWLGDMVQEDNYWQAIVQRFKLRAGTAILIYWDLYLAELVMGIVSPCKLI